MRHRMWIVATAVLLLVPAACGGGGGDGDGGGSRAGGRVRPGSTTLFSAGDEPTSTTASTAVGGTATTGGGGAASTGTTVGGAAPPASPEAAAATAALNTYLDALAKEEYRVANDSSRDAARALAFVRSLLRDHNAARGATTTLRYATRRFTVADVTPDRVSFSGRAELTTTTRQGKESTTSTTELADPVVRFDGAWRVTDLFLDRKPIVFQRGTSTARHTGAPVTVRLIGAFTAGNSTAVVVGFDVEKETRVEVAKDILRWGSETKSSTLRLLSGAYAYFSYPRRDDRPSAWRAEFTIDGSNARLTLNF